jgi:hypothetical protein
MVVEEIPEEFGDPEFDSKDLEDFPVEPQGPSHTPDICSTPAPTDNINSKAECTICGDALEATVDSNAPRSMIQTFYTAEHLFHHECLEDLFNGIEDHLIKCPACREVICPRRPRAAVEPDRPATIVPGFVFGTSDSVLTMSITPHIPILQWHLGGCRDPTGTLNKGHEHRDSICH